MFRSKYEKCLPGLFRYTQEGQFFVQECAIDTSLKTSHSCPYTSRSAKPKDTPMRLLVFTQTTILKHGFKRDATKVFIPNAYFFLFMPLFLQLGLLFFCHHSSTSTPYSFYSSKALLAYMV
jgi:hypothetical protein